MGGHSEGEVVCGIIRVYVAGSGHRLCNDHKWLVHAFKSNGREMSVPAYLHKLSRGIQVTFDEMFQLVLSTW